MSGFDTQVSVGPDGCGFNSFTAASEIFSNPGTPPDGPNWIFCEGSLIESSCRIAEDGPIFEEYDYVQSTANLRALYQVQSGRTSVLYTRLTGRIQAYQLPCEFPSPNTPDRGMLAIITVSTPSPRIFAISGRNGSVVSWNGFESDEVAVSGNIWSFDFYSETGLSSGQFIETGLLVGIATGSTLTIDGTGEVNCDDIRIIQQQIKTGIPVLSAEQEGRLNINCLGSSVDVIDCEDLFLITQIGTQLYNSCELGDSNGDDLRDWCDVSILTDIISSDNGYFCGESYDILLDLNLDRINDEFDLALLRQPLQRIIGDSTGDGRVDFNDITQTLAHFNQNGPSWDPYDGNIGFVGDANGTASSILPM